jgi:hypothetical protein
MATISTQKNAADDICTLRESIFEMKKDLSLMKKRMIDIDTVLMDDDIESLNAADRDFKARKTKRL